MATKRIIKAAFTSGFRFVNTKGESVAVLDNDGRFTLKDGNANIEIFPSWSDFVKQMSDAPTTGDEEAILKQLESLVLAKRQVVEGTESTSTAAEPAPKAATPPTKKEETNMATKKAAPAKKAAPKKESAPKEQQPCVCGCGTKVNKNFAQGHDARVHGWGKKIARGDMKFNDIGTKDYPSKDPDRAIKFLKNELGIKQG